MPNYRISLVRLQTFYMDVEADDEESAQEAAFDVAPGLSAQESGWGQEWNVDADDWQIPEDFYGKEYDEKFHGKSVELISD